MNVRLLAVIAALGAALPLRAGEPPAKWTDQGEASLASTNGNSQGTTTSVKDLYTYHWSEVTDLELAGGAFGANSHREVTAENYNASEKLSKKLVGKDYAFERFGWDKDRFAGIADRYDGSAGVGRLLLDFPKDKLNFELGGGYVGEQLTDAPHQDYGSGRSYFKYEHDISSTSKFTQAAEYLHDFSYEKAYRINTETAVIAALSTHLSLKASFVWKRNGQPPPGFVKDDTITLVSLVVNY
jgi:putative salt-induced outer membrane protein